MGTVVRWRGWEIRIYSNDHLPPHAHAILVGRGEAKIVLGDGSVLASFRLSASEIGTAQRIVTENRDVLEDAWRRFHGN